MSNEHVSWRDMLQPHVQGTRKRVVEQEGGDVLVVHDTTDMTLPIYWPDRRRRHLVPTTSRSQGMLLHESLAVSASGESLPLGTLAIQPYVHQDARVSIRRAGKHGQSKADVAEGPADSL